MKFLVSLFLLGSLAQAGVVEDPYAGAPLVLRIVRMSEKVSSMEMFDSDGKLRLKFFMEEEENVTFYYYSSNGSILGHSEMNRETHQTLMSLRRKVMSSCPVYVTLARHDLTITDVSVRECSLPDKVEYKITRAEASSFVAANAYADDLLIMTISFYSKWYQVPLLSSQTLALSEELETFFFRALRTVSEECPVFVTVRTQTLEILNARPTCDILR